MCPSNLYFLKLKNNFFKLAENVQLHSGMKLLGQKIALQRNIFLHLFFFFVCAISRMFWKIQKQHLKGLKARPESHQHTETVGSPGAPVPAGQGGKQPPPFPAAGV